MIESKILEVLTSSTKAHTITELAYSLQIERELVLKAMMNLKEKGIVTQPKRCYWTLFD